MNVVRCLGIAATGLIMLGAPGCGPKDPGASGPEPIITADAPQTSEEAAAQQEAEMKKEEATKRGRRGREY
jgi:hypothetical protein